MKFRASWFLVLLLNACSSVAPEDSLLAPSLSDLDAFRPLSLALGAGCASLDCHGQPPRNLRLFDARGMRLLPQDRTGEGSTTEDEILANHRSLVGLEAQLTASVLAERGARPERLLLVRKARGLEAHQGGAPWPARSHGDLCLLSWLSGSIDATSCSNASLLPPPPAPP